MNKLYLVIILIFAFFACENKEKVKFDKQSLKNSQNNSQAIFSQVADFPSINDSSNFI